MRAIDAGLSCRECRKEYDDADTPTPCDIEILDDGTCQFGMPEVVPENMQALSLYSDMMAFGWSATAALNDLDLSPEERGSLLVKMRVIASEQAAIDKEKLTAPKGVQ